MTDAVLDAGPLIHLSELDALGVLSDLEVLRVSNTVWDEVAAHQPQTLKHRRLSFQRANVSTPSAELQALAIAFALDRGEVESLSLMETYPAAMFLTDDAAARTARRRAARLSRARHHRLVDSQRAARGKKNRRDSRAAANAAAAINPVYPTKSSRDAGQGIGERMDREGLSAMTRIRAPVGTKLGRNDPCWCSSGRKYKNCHRQSDMK